MSHAEGSAPWLRCIYCSRVVAIFLDSACHPAAAWWPLLRTGTQQIMPLSTDCAVMGQRTRFGLSLTLVSCSVSAYSAPPIILIGYPPPINCCAGCWPVGCCCPLGHWPKRTTTVRRRTVSTNGCKRPPSGPTAYPTRLPRHHRAGHRRRHRPHRLPRQALHPAVRPQTFSIWGRDCSGFPTP